MRTNILSDNPTTAENATGTAEGNATTVPASRGNSALEDYQMQIMLLHRHHAKRVAMAEQATEEAQLTDAERAARAQATKAALAAEFQAMEAALAA